ncbi:MAG: hypothetical protein ACRBCK_01325 [Alphaproteobacteria bacterium]
MNSVATYLFNPMADDAVDVLSDIAQDYQNSLTGPHAPEALQPRNPLDKDVETMRSLQHNFNYNGVTLGHFNNTLFVSYTSTADEQTARNVEDVEFVDEFVQSAVAL